MPRIVLALSLFMAKLGDETLDWRLVTGSD